MPYPGHGELEQLWREGHMGGNAAAAGPAAGPVSGPAAGEAEVAGPVPDPLDFNEAEKYVEAVLQQPQFEVIEL